MKQTIGNACGTIGMIHSVGTNAAVLPLADGSFLQRFVRDTEGMTFAERGKFLEEHDDLEKAHDAAAREGDTAAPGADDDVDLHFVCFSCVDGCLYELDGRKPGPVNHGASSGATLLEDAVRVVQQFVSRSDSLNFNVIALAKNE
mmetsp:Transcript_14687/g.46757  ORF Transcript_14687/g.46757 Transcript_14687/m.46757 type:complete len:145 (+) Transcript_14687:184-618(+)